MATYVLVHGAWHGAWCWENIIPALEKAGHTVYAPDLPGHGQDSTPLKQITLQTYVDTIKSILDKVQGKVILVGHSMAGVVISQVAEYWPEKIEKLVYVAAFLPQNGDFLSEMGQRLPQNKYAKDIHGVSKEAAIYFPFKHMDEFGYNCCDKALLERISPLFCVEPLRPFFDKVSISSERFGTIPRVYVACLDDKAIAHVNQLRMIENTPCEVHTLACDHSPFYSAPNALIDILIS